MPADVTGMDDPRTWVAGTVRRVGRSCKWGVWREGGRGLSVLLKSMMPLSSEKTQ
jgi:hypothetical protein